MEVVSISSSVAESLRRSSVNEHPLTDAAGELFSFSLCERNVVLVGQDVLVAFRCNQRRRTRDYLLLHLSSRLLCSPLHHGSVRSVKDVDKLPRDGTQLFLLVKSDGCLNVEKALQAVPHGTVLT
jgi:hypothetical protein